MDVIVGWIMALQGLEQEGGVYLSNPFGMR